MSFKGSLFIAIVSFCTGAAICYYFYPQVKEVAKEHIVTVTKERVLPGGVIEREIRVVEDRLVTETKEAKRKSWLLSATASSSLLLVPVYGVQLQYRLFGPVYVGVQGGTNGYIGALLGMEF